MSRQLKNVVRCALALCVVYLGLAGPVSAQPQLPTATRTSHRQLGVYVGTWTVFMQGNPNPIGTYSFVEFTDHITAGIVSSIQNDPAADARVKLAAPLWVFPPGVGVEWVLGTPENLSASASFAAAVSALGGTVTADSGFVPMAGATYLLGTVDTIETAPVFVGDLPGGAITFGADGATVQITNNFVADVSYTMRNGSVTLPAVSKCPLSHGYWKNNLGLWTFNALTLSTQAYAKPQLLTILGLNGSDASVILGKQLVAAKLNIGYGSDPSPIAATVAAADALLGNARVPANVKTSSSLGKAMTAAGATLQDYNTGHLTTICLP